jgi:hypothetical protein
VASTFEVYNFNFDILSVRTWAKDVAPVESQFRSSSSFVVTKMSVCSSSLVSIGEIRAEVLRNRQNFCRKKIAKSCD